MCWKSRAVKCYLYKSHRMSEYSLACFYYSKDFRLRYICLPGSFAFIFFTVFFSKMKGNLWQKGNQTSTCDVINETCFALIWSWQLAWRWIVVVVVVVVMVVAFSSSERFWENVRQFIPPPSLAHFLLKWRLSRANKFHFLGQGQSTVAQRAETTMDECSLASCVCTRFPDRFPHYACTATWSAHSDFAGSRAYACFRCNLLPALWAEWPGSFTCHCRNPGERGGTDIE